MATYQYTISTQTASGTVNLSILEEEISALGGNFKLLTGTSATGDILDTVFSGDLSAGEQTTLTSTVAAHNGSVSVPEFVDFVPNIAQYRQSVNGTITTTAGTIPLDATDFEDSNYTRSGSEITVNTSGIYRVSYSVYFDTNANARRTIDAWVENDTVEIIPSRSTDYSRNTVDDTGSASATFITQISATDVIRLRAQSTGTSGTPISVGNRIWILLEFIRSS